jgi:hypothetical protein
MRNRDGLPRAAIEVPDERLVDGLACLGGGIGHCLVPEFRGERVRAGRPYSLTDSYYLIIEGDDRESDG